MTPYTIQRTFKRLVDVPAPDPALKRLNEWLPVNKGFHQAFLDWLKASNFSLSTIGSYSVASRYTFSLLDTPYWKIDLATDLEQVWRYLQTRPITPSTLDTYRKGLAKLAEYLRLRCHKPIIPKTIDWEYFTGPLPAWLKQDIVSLVMQCQRNWKLDRQIERSCGLLSALTRPLRWIADHYPLNEIADLTPQAWYAYLDMRLVAGINPKTINRELAAVKHLVFLLQDEGRVVNERFLRVDYLDEAKDLPRDVPIVQLRALLQEIQKTAEATNANIRRSGRMDRAWFLLMLHSGLRTCEVRSLRPADIDWEGKRVHIEQSKDLKDRVVYLSQASLAALHAYLEVRGPADALPDSFFVFRHAPLTCTYCSERLHTYGKCCAVSITPHQLRHSHATLLLNSGAPVLTVQALLGHKWVDTTLGYARLYDGTVAADYYQAMAVVERRMALPEDRLSQPPGLGQLVALVDSLHVGTLNPAQTEVLRLLRAGLLALAEEPTNIGVVKVQI